jgi:hypothetical protein
MPGIARPNVPGGSACWTASIAFTAAVPISSDIAQIRELLDTLEKTTSLDVDEYRRELPNWTAMVLSYDNGWSQAAQFDGASCGG